jgi:hypothetical protein
MGREPCCPAGGLAGEPGRSGDRKPDQARLARAGLAGCAGTGASPGGMRTHGSGQRLIKTGRSRHRCCAKQPAGEGERHSSSSGSKHHTREDVLRKLSAEDLVQRHTTG